MQVLLRHVDLRHPTLLLVEHRVAGKQGGGVAVFPQTQQDEVEAGSRSGEKSSAAGAS